MSGPPVLLDFAGPRVRTTLTGVVLLIFGLGAIAAACLEYHAVTLKRAGLELKLAAALRRSSLRRIAPALSAGSRDERRRAAASFSSRPARLRVTA